MPDKIKADINFCIKCTKLRFITSKIKDATREGTMACCELHGYGPPEMGMLDDKVFIESAIMSELSFLKLCIIPNVDAYIPDNCVFKLENLMRNDNPDSKTL